MGKAFLEPENPRHDLAHLGSASHSDCVSSDSRRAVTKHNHTCQENYIVDQTKSHRLVEQQRISNKERTRRLWHTHSTRYLSTTSTPLYNPSLDCTVSTYTVFSPADMHTVSILQQSHNYVTLSRCTQHTVCNRHQYVQSTVYLTSRALKTNLNIQRGVRQH